MNWDGLHCPSWTGGVAATSIKVAKHRQGADGVVVQMFCSSLNNHPVCADSGFFAIFSFWHSHPSCPGGAMGLIPIVHIDRSYHKEKVSIKTAMPSLHRPIIPCLSPHRVYHSKVNEYDYRLSLAGSAVLDSHPLAG